LHFELKNFSLFQLELKLKKEKEEGSWPYTAIMPRSIMLLSFLSAARLLGDGFGLEIKTH
jgi:hypothetical protein